MSYEQSIKLPSIQTSVKNDRKDLHLHIDLRLDANDLAALERETTQGDCVTPSREQLIAIAWKIYEARRTRYRMLDRDLLGEPAWDMLLALYCLPERGERLSVSSLSLAAELPQSTGHRWQFILAQRELIDQVADPSDGRRQFIELSNKGRDLLESYLTQLFRCGNYLAS